MDPELVTATEDEDQQMLGHKRGAPSRTWKYGLTALAAAAGLALLAWRGSKPSGPPRRSFSLPEGALPEGVVGLSEDLAELSGTLSTGVNYEALATEGFASELHGCCPLVGGQYLECCSLAGQCCPTAQGMLLSCCPQYRPPEPLQTCSGELGKNICAADSECCNGLCCGEGATCCGQICCGKGSTCCKDKGGAYVCGAEGNVCGGETGGVPLHWSNWPNPATPKGWSKEKPYGVTVFQAPPKPDSLVQCHGENGQMVCLNNAACCNGLCCGPDSQCCGNICCGKESTCCKNPNDHFFCAAPGNVCGHGAPLHPSDWQNVPKDQQRLAVAIAATAPAAPPAPSTV